MATISMFLLPPFLLTLSYVVDTVGQPTPYFKVFFSSPSFPFLSSLAEEVRAGTPFLDIDSNTAVLLLLFSCTATNFPSLGQEREKEGSCLPPLSPFPLHNRDYC